MASVSSATIRGISYTEGKTFTAAESVTGKASSDGSGSSSSVTKGNTYCFIKYNEGASYPYAIGTGSSTTVRCWVKAAAFPYATYTISYNANGGSGAPGSQTKTYGTNLTLSSTKPTRTGYTFQGWATSSSATSATYAAGGTYTANAAATLYAVWKANTYTVSYNANGGSGAPSSQTKTYGVTLTLSSTKPTRTGYTFQGWATSSGGSVAYSAGGSYTANASVTLYAVWKADTYTVSYNANGGSGAPSSQTKTYNVSLTLSSTKPTRTGYTFLGWATSSTGSVAYAPGATYTSNAAVTLYAVWEINTYTVTFNASANGGEGDTTRYVDYGGSVGSNMPLATKDHYSFVGWFTAAEGGTMVTGSETITGNVTYYAQFVIDAVAHVYSGGVYRTAFPYVYINGQWEKTYAYVYSNGAWHQSIA